MRFGVVDIRMRFATVEIRMNGNVFRFRDEPTTGKQTTEALVVSLPVVDWAAMSLGVRVYIQVWVAMLDVCMGVVSAESRKDLVD